MVGEVIPREPEDARPAPSQLRASHEDRDAVIEMLRVAAGFMREVQFNFDRMSLAATSGSARATAGPASAPGVISVTLVAACPLLRYRSK